MTTDIEEVTKKGPVKLTELLMRTEVGQSFFIETKDADDALNVMRSVHARAANMTKVRVKSRTKKIKYIVDADPAIPGDVDTVETLIKVTVISRAID